MNTETVITADVWKDKYESEFIWKEILNDKIFVK